MVHGLSRRTRTPSSDLHPVHTEHIEASGNSINDIDQANSTNNTTHDIGNTNSTTLPSAFVGAENSQYFPVAVEANPWLSWGWVDASWGDLEPTSFFDPNASNGEVIGNSSTSGVAFDAQSLGSGASSSRIASIIDARLDPVEYHRQSILRRLEQYHGIDARETTLYWLDRAHFPILLKNYFIRHHRHTPIIHLGTLNIAESSTVLIFALILIAASSLPSLRLESRDLISLVRCAHQMALSSDEVCLQIYNILCFANGEKEPNVGGSESASLGTLQALVLLAILDRIMLKRTSDIPYFVSLGEIAHLARTSKLFEHEDVPSASWQQWAVVESRRR